MSDRQMVGTWQHLSGVNNAHTLSAIRTYILSMITGIEGLSVYFLPNKWLAVLILLLNEIFILR